MADDNTLISLKGPNTIRMNLSPTDEVLRFEANGDIYVRGKLVTNDLEVVEALRAFLCGTGHLKERG